jgi:hypothetical protein
VSRTIPHHQHALAQDHGGGCAPVRQAFRLSGEHRRAAACRWRWRRRPAAWSRAALPGLLAQPTTGTPTEWAASMSVIASPMSTASLGGATAGRGLGGSPTGSASCVARRRGRALRCVPISPLKDHAGNLIRPGDPVPPYAGFPLVSHLEQIVAPYTRDAHAVRLHEDDITSWVGYALARLAVKRADTGGSSVAPAAPAVRPEPRAYSPPRAVVRALLEGGEAHGPAAVGQATFIPHPEANQLILDEPFAFLLAVIFDQGIPAERAWRARYDLMERLGHLDPARMLTDPGRR